jgi:hypothetical protein
MAITGHETEAMVAHYRRDADKTERAISPSSISLRGPKKPLP